MLLLHEAAYSRSHSFLLVYWLLVADIYKTFVFVELEKEKNVGSFPVFYLQWRELSSLLRDRNLEMNSVEWVLQ
jgi:hypothetical protein